MKKTYKRTDLEPLAQKIAEDLSKTADPFHSTIFYVTNKYYSNNTPNQRQLRTELYQRVCDLVRTKYNKKIWS